MKHLKLGTYSFFIDVDELEIGNNLKEFTREQLPDNLKPLFDLVRNGISEKSVFVYCKSRTLTTSSGFLHVTQSDYSYVDEIVSLHIVRSGSNNTITMKYDEL